MPSTPADRLLVPSTWLAKHLDDPAVRIVDARYYLLGARTGAAEYAAGHLPGAVFLDVDRDLSSRGAGASGPGRHPLPTAEAFADVLGRVGISDHTLVVAYDDAGGAYAARVWFLLRYFGHETGRLLDGGLDGWRAVGGTLTQVVPTPAPGLFTPRPRPELVVDRAHVNARRGRSEVLLLDARALERYRGESEPIDPVAGHIPGARSAPFAKNLAADGRFLDDATLSERYRDLGAERAAEVIAYCGSGVTACHNLLALELAGVRGAKLYEGSWSDWSGSGLPVETGGGS